MTKPNYMALADFQDLWTNQIKPAIPSIAGTADVQNKADKLGEAFSTEKPYAVGAYVTHGGNLYECTTAHAAGAWNADHFTLATDRIMILSGAGNIKDSGKKTSDFATAAQGTKADNAAPQATTYTKTEVDSKIAECERKYMLSVAGSMLVFAASPAVVVSGTKLVLG